MSTKILVTATDVECPTCGAWVGWACEGSDYGYHAAGYLRRIRSCSFDDLVPEYYVVTIVEALNAKFSSAPDDEYFFKAVPDDYQLRKWAP